MDMSVCEDILALAAMKQRPKSYMTVLLLEPVCCNKRQNKETGLGNMGTSRGSD